MRFGTVHDSEDQNNLFIQSSYKIKLLHIRQQFIEDFYYISMKILSIFI